MTERIVFSGIGYGVQFIELDDDELKQLLEEIEDSDDVLSVKKFSDLYDESYYDYGLLHPSEDRLTLTINEEDCSTRIDELISKCRDPIYRINVSSEKNLLVYEGLETIDFIYTADEFNLEQLEINTKTVSLPSGETHTLLNPYYKGNQFDYSDATVNGRFRIFDKSGKEINF